MDRRPPNRKPVDNSDLARLPMNTMAKSMKPLEDIMIRYIGKGELTDDEERLLDRVMFERTGQHIGKFKNKTPKPQKPTHNPKLKLDVASNDGSLPNPSPTPPSRVS